MNPAARRKEDSASAPVLYMALELSNKSWRLALSDGARRRQVSVPAADLMQLSEAVAKAKERFGMPASARVLSCYEAGRDGFWLHRHLRRVGIENEVIDAASIEVSRRLRHVKTDRLDGDRLLDKLIRHHAGERGGWRALRNRREVAALAGLVGTPYNSGDSERDQGISKAGNRRVRAMMVEIAWLWLRFQPKSTLTQWYQARFAGAGLRMRRIGIVALARRLLIALWRYLTDGVIPEGARLIASEI